MLHYPTLRARCEAHRQSVWARAQALCVAAGLSDAGHLHNAMVSYDLGKPWRDVDYQKARAARRLFDRQFAASRWLTGLYQKRGPQGFTFDDRVS